MTIVDELPHLISYGEKYIFVIPIVALASSSEKTRISLVGSILICIRKIHIGLKLYPPFPSVDCFKTHYAKNCSVKHSRFIATKALEHRAILFDANRIFIVANLTRWKV